MADETPTPNEKPTQPAEDKSGKLSPPAVNVLTFLFIIALISGIIYMIIYYWPGKNAAAFNNEEQRYFMLVALGGALGALVHVATSFVSFLGNQKLYIQWLPWYFMRPFIGSAIAIILYTAIRGGIVTYTPVPAANNNKQDSTEMAVKPAKIENAAVIATATNDSTKDSLHTATTTSAPIETTQKPKEDNKPGEAPPFNPFGIMSLACLAGMFSKQAAKKLQEVFETLFPVKDADPLHNPLDNHD
ncbi:MAG TPA: hypothetical protein VG603_09180 [Chitinophagales bacterium]|nr:hypothetical protein [Chitinophagales bacterium]